MSPLSPWRQLHGFTVAATTPGRETNNGQIFPRIRFLRSSRPTSCRNPIWQPDRVHNRLTRSCWTKHELRVTLAKSSTLSAAMLSSCMWRRAKPHPTIRSSPQNSTRSLSRFLAWLKPRFSSNASTMRIRHFVKLQLASPDNARLGFLRAQLDQLQLRNATDGARIAIREGRFEDAAASIAMARQLSVGDPADIAAVSAELDAARSEQQVDEVLTLAAQRLEDGRLIEPANNNARYYYELALGNDPANTAAKQGLVLIAGKLVLQARESIDNGQLDGAEALLRNARALDPESTDLSASTRALESARSAESRQRPKQLVFAPQNA